MFDFLKNEFAGLQAKFQPKQEGLLYAKTEIYELLDTAAAWSDKIEEYEAPKSIQIRVAARDALFLRSSKKFQNVQDYLDLLKIAKGRDIYKELGVDLDSGNLYSIDTFCLAALGPGQFEREYMPVKIMAVVFVEPKAKKTDNNSKPVAKKEEVINITDDVVPVEEEEKIIPSFENLIVEDKEEHYDAIKFHTEDPVKGTAGNGESEAGDSVNKGTGEGAEEAVQKVTGGTSDSGTRDGSSGNSGTGFDTPVNTVPGLKRELDLVAEAIKKYTDGHVTVQPTYYADGSNIGTYDVIVQDKNGIRAYTVDQGSIIPGRKSVIALTRNGNFTMAVPLVKKEKELLKKIFATVYFLSNEEFEHLRQAYYLGNITLYNNLDLTGAEFIYNLSAKDKSTFEKNVKFTLDKILTSTNGRSMRYRITNFKNIHEFELVSDSQVVSPFPGLLTSNDIGFIRVAYKKDSNIAITSSDDMANTITSPVAPQVEIKDHRVTA